MPCPPPQRWSHSLNVLNGYPDCPDGQVAMYERPKLIGREGSRTNVRKHGKELDGLDISISSCP